MIITCPRCSAQYGVDLVRFGLRARTVQCTACDWQWEAGGPEDDPAEFRVADEAVVVAVAEPVLEEDIASQPVAETVAERPVRPADFLPADSGCSESVAEAGPVGRVLSPDKPDESGVAGSGCRDDAVEFPDALTDRDARVDNDRMPATEAAESDSAVADWLTSEPASPSPSRRRRLVITGTAAASLLVAVATLIAVQGPISRALPGAAAVYHLFGLAPAPPGVGLDIRDVASSREWTGLEDVLVVSGSVTNVASAPRTLPPLRVALFDDEHTEVQTVLVEPVKAVLAAGESVQFVARIVNPVNAARRMVVSFEISAAEQG